MPHCHKHMMLNVTLRKPPTEPAQVEEWLRRVVDKVRMQIMFEPRAGWDDTPGNEGVTGLVVLTTSHCSIHVWNGENPPYAKLDLYSCAEFDPEEFVEMVGEFDPYWVDYLVVDRNEPGFTVLAQETRQVIDPRDLLSPEHREILVAYESQPDLTARWGEAMVELDRVTKLYGVGDRSA